MNRIERPFKTLPWFMALLLTAFVAACGGGGGGGGSTAAPPPAGPANVIPGVAGTAGAAATNPTVNSSNPSSGATNVPTSTNTTGVAVSVKLLTATFSQAMLPGTITPVGTFTLKNNTLAGVDVPGVVTINGANTVATFTPGVANLNAATSYTATISTAAKNAGGTAIPNPVVWSFTTAAVLTTGQAPLDLSAIEAGNFAIFAATGITDSPPASTITGSIGNSGLGSSITVACVNVVGVDGTGAANKIYDDDAGYADAACRLTAPATVLAAQGGMTGAYTEAAGRTAGVGPALNIQGGAVTTQTLTPGVYTWTTAMSITGDLTLSGGADDVWIFQIAGTFDLTPGSKILLAGTAKAKNIYWQAAGSMTLNTTSRFEGIALGQTLIATKAGAAVNGRLLAQAAATLINTTVTIPSP